MCKFPGKEVYQKIRQALNQAANDWKTKGLEDLRVPLAEARSPDPTTHLTNDKNHHNEGHLQGLQCHDIFEETPSQSEVEPVDMDCADCEPHSPRQLTYDLSQGQDKIDVPVQRPLCGVPKILPSQHKRGRQHVDDAHCHDEPSHKIAHFQAFKVEAPFPFPSSQLAED